MKTLNDKLFKFIAVLLFLFLASCSTSMTSLEESKSATRAERTYTENYQEIYRRITNEAKRCQTGIAGAFATMNVQAQLYNELGFGEIALFMTNMGTRNFYWTAKVEKMPEGSKLTVISGNTIRNKANLNMVLNWADGNTGCSAL